MPNLADPYNTLGVLHEVLGQPRKALDFYMIAAHMTGKVRGALLYAFELLSFLKTLLAPFCGILWYLYTK